MDGCHRNFTRWAGDIRVGKCIADLGVRITPEVGFHHEGYAAPPRRMPHAAMPHAACFGAPSVHPDQQIHAHTRARPASRALGTPRRRRP